MTSTLDLNRRVDLLRERRQELRVLTPAEVLQEQLNLLARGGVWGAAIVGGVVALGLLITLRQQFVNASLGRVAAVEQQLSSLQNELNSRRAALQPKQSSSSALARALTTTPSGAALMRDLQDRVPQGVRLRELKVSGAVVTLIGEAQDPSGFERINALQLQLGGSPLLSEPRLTKASRNPAQGAKPTAPDRVAFEMQAQLRDLASSPGLQATLRRLGADGMEKRLQLMRQEGLLR